MMMTRRQLLIALAAVSAVAACGGSDSTTDPDSDGGPTTGEAEARSDATRAPGGDPIGTGAALTPFAVDVHRRLAADAGTGNLVFSPASIAFALAMTRNGAKGTTAAEMDAVLDAPAIEELNTILNGIDLALDARSGERQAGYDRKDTVQLSLANALWLQDGTPFEAAFLDTLARFYGAGANLVDYVGDAEGARETINAWVAEETRDKIPDLIPEGVLDEMTRLVLTNAIYLKASWDVQFEKSATIDGAFTTLAGTRAIVPFMAQNLQGGYARGDGWQAAELPYIGRELAMTVIVPDAGTFGRFETALDSDTLTAITAALQPREVVLRLPRWTTRTKAPLADLLAALGMPTAFDPGAADFSAMTTAERLYISAVIHEAFIAVDETGTEAAAATAVVARATSAPIEPPPELTVDRPFLYAIRDVPTNTILFLGRVADPTEQ